MTKTNYLILIPPSETKTNLGDENKPYRFVKNKKEYNFFMNNLWIEREKVYGILRETISEYSFEELEKIFELKNEKLKDAISLNEDLLNQNSIEAIKRYSGTMFKNIDFEHLNKNQKENFKESVFIIEGLFGILKSTDYIPNYKLKINTKLKNLNLVEFWKENLEPIISKFLDEKILIDLLPQEHRKVIQTKNNKENKNYIEINFIKINNNTNKIQNVGHDSKILKAELIKYILEKERINYEFLTKFEHSLGYKFDKENSDQNKISFLKNE